MTEREIIEYASDALVRANATGLTEDEREAIVRSRFVVIVARIQNNLLRDLLAVIHRDGGHHTDEVGIEKSVADAHTRILELFAKESPG